MKKLDAAHEAISSFFLLHTLFEEEARVWFHFQHRAFSEAVSGCTLSSIRYNFISCPERLSTCFVQLVIAELIKNKPEGFSSMDPLYMRAKNDLLRMIGILQLSSDADLVSRTRVGVLSN